MSYEWEEAKYRIRRNPHWQQYADNARDRLEHIARTGSRNRELHHEDIACLLVYIEMMEETLSQLVMDKQSTDPERERYMLDKLRYDADRVPIQKYDPRDFRQLPMPRINPKFLHNI